MNYNLQKKVTQPAFAPMLLEVTDALRECTQGLHELEKTVVHKHWKFHLAELKSDFFFLERFGVKMDEKEEYHDHCHDYGMSLLLRWL